MMNHRILKLFAFLTAFALLCGSASAISFSGVVAASDTLEIYAPIGGTVERVNVSAGQKVAAGDVLATLSTTKVYASESGVITGIFGVPGDSAETISERYGAVMYIEGESVYTISASTEDAYNTTENKFVHVGEEVSLICYSHGSHSGSGRITAVQGTDFTVEVSSGEFLLDETVTVFRGEDTASSSRIGRGTLGRRNPTAVSGSGSIVSIAVEDGAQVQKGDLLFETLDGSFDGLYMSGTQILAQQGGVVSSLNLQQGGKLEKGSVAASIYPDGAMRVEASVSEYNLSELAVGDQVLVELIWNQDAEVSYPGVISMISAIANEGAGEDADVSYTVYVDFTPDADTRYGMSAVVSTLDETDMIEAVENIETEEDIDEAD